MPWMLVALSVLVVLVPDLARPQSAPSPEVSKKTVVISGNVRIPNVWMKGLPGLVSSGEDGRYQVAVPSGFSGTVTPEKQGYSFEPKSRAYNSVSQDQGADDYVARVLTFAISGRVDQPGVWMKGSPGEVMSDTAGRYQITVDFGWTGTITPEKEGYIFEPASRKYTPVTEDRRNENYAAKPVMFSIMGNAGVPDARIAGLPGLPITDKNGNYSASVPYRFSGVVTPSKDGYTFEPVKREYVHVTEDLTDENYSARSLMVLISEKIVIDDEPVQDVHITADPGGYSAVTDAQGRYSIQVPYGWTGKLIHAKEGFAFDPPGIAYESVTSDIIDGVPVSRSDGTRTRWPRTPSAYPGATAPQSGGNVLVIPTKEVAPEQFTQTAEDMRVMLNILREKLSEPRTIRGVLYDYGDFFGDAGRTAEALYLQGHAAIFLLKADFPLSPPMTQGQAEGQKAEPADPVWQRARDRLYSPQNAGVYGPRGMSPDAQERSFEQIKDDLIKTLKHAANIRNIDPNESIILTVTGQSDAAFPGAPYGFGGGAGGGTGGGGWMSGGASGGGGGSVSGGGMGGYGGGYSSSGSFNYAGSGGFRAGSGPQMGMGRGGMGRAPGVPPAPASATVLTIQAKKADIDAFAKGSLPYDQFQQKVEVFTY